MNIYDEYSYILLDTNDIKRRENVDSIHIVVGIINLVFWSFIAILFSFVLVAPFIILSFFIVLCEYILEKSNKYLVSSCNKVKSE